MPKRKEFRFIGNVPTKTIQGYKQLSITQLQEDFSHDSFSSD